MNSINPSPARFNLRALKQSRLANIGALPILMVLSLVLFEMSNTRFLSADNLLNISQQSIFLILIALGQMLVLVSGGFDLSVGATVALTSVVSSTAMVAVQAGHPDNPTLAIAAGCGATVLVGMVVGLANGIGVSLFRVNPFIVTLATSSVISGSTLLISQGNEIGPLPDAFVFNIGSGMIAGMPVSILLAIPAVAIIYLLVNRFRYGRYLFAIGSNPKSALVSGVRVNYQLMLTYILCALLTSFAGLLLTARVSSGQPLLGAEYPLLSITAAVIGGCSLKGGQGGVIGTLMGALFVTMLANGMDLVRLGSNYQMIALGIILVIAVLLDRNRR